MAKLNFQRARFQISAPTLAECPADEGFEVAFAGRSNAGKSSALNTLADNGKLARTSKTPGRTQLINFFSLTPERRLVDLPGYGYAKVSLAVKREWQEHLTAYLQDRESLRGLVLVMDIRHPLQDVDTDLINWAVSSELPVHLLLTKADKLKKGPAQSTLLAVRKHMQEAGVDDLVSVQTFSSLKKSGLDQLRERLENWLEWDEHAE